MVIFQIIYLWKPIIGYANNTIFRDWKLWSIRQMHSFLVLSLHLVPICERVPISDQSEWIRPIASPSKPYAKSQRAQRDHFPASLKGKSIFCNFYSFIVRPVSVFAVVEWAVVAVGIIVGLVGNSVMYSKQYVDYYCCNYYEHDCHLRIY